MENIDIKELSRDEFLSIVKNLPLDAKLKAYKYRCETGDKAACKVYDIAVNGNENAPAGTPEYLGLKGRWLENKDERARKILEAIGEL